MTPRAPRLGRTLVLAGLLAMWPAVADAMLIPAFARQYRTGCTTCHVAAPKLNALGEAFRLNGYRLPENAALLRKEAPVPLGEDPWKDLWPRAIWPGEAPGTAPFAIRVGTGLVVQRAPREGPSFTLRMPDDVYLMAGSSLGDGIGAMLIAEWDREEGVEVRQAKVLFRDVLPVLPERALNVTVGLQNLYLLTAGDRQVDRAGLRAFGWQGFSWAQVDMRPVNGGLVTSSAQFTLGDAQPAIGVNGIIGGRTFYSAGLAQGTTEGTTDENNRKDLFYTIRHKWGGLRFDGTYDPGDGPPARSFGQLMDNAIVLEHFAYVGGEPVGDGRTSRIRAAGVALRVTYRGTDVALGAIRRRDGNPWSRGVSAAMTNAFARGEYMLYPWLLASVKVERLSARTRSAGGEAVPAGYALATPGVIALVRQNIRLVVEGDLFLRHDASAAEAVPRPRRLTARLDVSY